VVQASIQQPIPRTAKPTCLVWYPDDPCDQRIQQYDQLAAQRLQLEGQAALTARFQAQIADQQRQLIAQQNQVKTLQIQIDSQTQQALQSEARNQALLDGIGAGIGAGLAFLMAVAVFRRLARNATVAKTDLRRAASA
jgi:hypothetical protein